MDAKSLVEGRTGLCLGAYWATQDERKLILRAVGVKISNSGCSSDLDFAGESPDFEFLHICILDRGASAFTPFDVSKYLRMQSRSEFVTIADAQGKHQIPVQQWPVCPCKEEEVTTVRSRSREGREKE